MMGFVGDRKRYLDDQFEDFRNCKMTTTCTFCGQMLLAKFGVALGYIHEVNASDSRGKADAKIKKGIGGSNANSIKELVSNETLSVNMDRSKHVKTVLIMDEVDGMSAGVGVELLTLLLASRFPKFLLSAFVMIDTVRN